MAIVKEFKSRTGGTIRIMDDCLPKTEEERRQRMQRIERTCRQVLEQAVTVLGAEETLRRMNNGPHAWMLEGGTGT